MTTGIAGQRAGNMIVPLSNMTKSTKFLSIGSGSISASTNSSSIGGVKGQIICYADSAGNWRANVQLNLTLTIAHNATYFSLSYNGLKFKDTLTQNGNAFIDNALYKDYNTGFYTTPNASTITVVWQTAIAGPNSVPVYIDFDVALEQEPTTYTIPANMEARISAEVYVEPASTTAAGIVTTGAQSLAGVKTFADVTDASSSTVGGLITSGGLAVAKKAYVGTDLNTGGKVLVASTVNATSKDTGSIITEGGIGVEQDVYAGGNMYATNFQGTHRSTSGTFQTNGSGVGSVIFDYDATMRRMYLVMVYNNQYEVHWYGFVVSHLEGAAYQPAVVTLQSVGVTAAKVNNVNETKVEFTYGAIVNLTFQYYVIWLGNR